MSRSLPKTFVFLSTLCSLILFTSLTIGFYSSTARNGKNRQHRYSWRKVSYREIRQKVYWNASLEGASPATAVRVIRKPDGLMKSFLLRSGITNSKSEDADALVSVDQAWSNSYSEFPDGKDETKFRKGYYRWTPIEVKCRLKTIWATDDAAKNRIERTTTDKLGSEWAGRFTLIHLATPSDVFQ